MPGAFGENFPYSNFHDLNMDWIVKIAKDFLDQYTNIQGTINTGLTNLNNKAEELETLLQQWYDTHSEDIETQLRDALQEFAVESNQIAERTIDSIPADYTDLTMKVYNNQKLEEELEQNANKEFVYKCNSDDSLYPVGATLTDAIYFPTIGYGYPVIPKGCTHAGFRIVNSSTSSHVVTLYIFEKAGTDSFTVKYKFEHLNMDNSRYLDVSIPTSDVDLYFGIQCENLYGLKYVDDNAAVGSAGLNTLYPASANVGETITVNRANNNRAYNVEVSAYMNIRENTNLIGNNSAQFTGEDLGANLEWLGNYGFYADTCKAGDTVDNFQYRLFPSQAGRTSKPFRIRDDSGRLLYNIIADADDITDAISYMEFDKYGRFISGYSMDHFRSTGFTNGAYYAAVREFYTLGNKWLIQPVKISWLNTKTETYTVGINGDFQTFTQMLRALKDNKNEKIVYVEEGTYDIYNEMGGAAYIQSITNPSQLNWRDVSDVVPDNTTIVGRGKVVLSFEPPANVIGSNAMAILFSPLNVSGSCTIENIEIRATNCRYAIHDETSNRPEFAHVERKYKNVIASKHYGSYGYEQCYGAGLPRTGLYEFENCSFYNDRNWTFSMHTNDMTDNDKINININNTIIGKHDEDYYHENTNCVGLGNSNISPKTVRVNLNNCWMFGDISIYAEGNMENRKDSFALKMIGCNDVAVTTTVPTTMPRIIKNTIAN